MGVFGVMASFFLQTGHTNHPASPRSPSKSKANLKFQNMTEFKTHLLKGTKNAGEIRTPSQVEMSPASDLS
jgi:hypothetical protein